MLISEGIMVKNGTMSQEIGTWADIGEKNENILNIMYGFTLGRLFLLC